MPKKSSTNGNSNERLTQLRVGGYKSIGREQQIEISPLTILAGTNSSGKSSMMQPLLLIKQTLEASYDPGVFLLDGPNVRFSDADQLFSHGTQEKDLNVLKFGFTVGANHSITAEYKKSRKGIVIDEVSQCLAGHTSKLRLGMSSDEIFSNIDPRLQETSRTMLDQTKAAGFDWYVERDRCFLKIAAKGPEDPQTYGKLTSLFSFGPALMSPSTFLENQILETIHVPGLRGNPERNYPVTAVGPTFPGTFEKYTASVIADWQFRGNKTKLNALSSDLKKLGLTWKVRAVHITDTQVGLQVGRLPLPRPIPKESRDLVSVADVGIGVSQMLPVLVALNVARPGQIVYLEQPEIHLHPRAQTELAQVLVRAAKRGVVLIIETHSSLLLLAIQTLVAEAKFPSEMVKLHWFNRDGSGMTHVSSADLNNAGAFGEWPEDFGEVTLEAESRYLDAAEQRQEVH